MKNQNQPILALTPTAKKTYHKVTGCVLEDHHFPNIEEAMIKFAKIHVSIALKEASEKAKCIEYMVGEYDIDKESILNSYSFDKIK